MSTTIQTRWYENVTQGTIHEVEAGSPLEERLQTAIRDNVDRADELAFRRGDKSKADRVLAYRRLSPSEVTAIQEQQADAARVAAEDRAAEARARADELEAEAQALRGDAGRVSEFPITQN